MVAAWQILAAIFQRKHTLILIYHRSIQALAGSGLHAKSSHITPTLGDVQYHIEFEQNDRDECLRMSREKKFPHSFQHLHTLTRGRAPGHIHWVFSRHIWASRAFGDGLTARGLWWIPRDLSVPAWWMLCNTSTNVSYHKVGRVPQMCVFNVKDENNFSNSNNAVRWARTSFCAMSWFSVWNLLRLHPDF